ncbi:hypothetical protein [Pedobacter montanisoli]|uniref:Uncharacterized protein n=1 Tax=Pedobacter montanisoli TaxID=2923277 RepID=A0ABS9ZXI0_9SPHI|nr:hypothetical protein [Pedobacter montanisoli]MCJ0742994.1 hypothetical protein [Pedobacter montanisoli]
MKIHFKIIGSLLMFLSFIHIFFPKYFNWKKELNSVSLINRQMMKVHTFFIALVVFLIGLLCLTSATDLIHTKLGKTITFGLGIFWGIRLFFQLFIYSSKLWKGKKFETSIHILFLLFWVYLSVVFFWATFN